MKTRKTRKRPLPPPRKKRRAAEKKPASGSLAWYKAEWAAMGKHDLPEAMIAGLAQLSYENRMLRRRVEALEACQLAAIFGKVERDGVLHLLECRKRDDPKAECTCGSLPQESSARATKRDPGGDPS